VSVRLSDHHRPGPDPPPRDQAVRDVGVVAGEALGDGRIVAAEEQDGTVHRVGEGAGHDQLAAFAGLAGEPEMVVSQ